MNSIVRSKHFFKDNAILYVALAFFLVAGFLNQKFPRPVPVLLKQDTAININKNFLVFLSAGNKRLITDLLWVQTLLESDMDHYTGHDLNSWMYVRFNTISELDPQFYQNYLWGGQYLAIVKDDLMGAVALMEKGVKLFPDSYRLNYNLGFAYYFELNDYEKGLVYLDKIKNHPKAPAFIPSLVVKLKVETGYSIDAALSVIFDLMTNSNDESLVHKLTKDFHALKSERDLVCLNQKKPNCEMKDAYGVPYINVAGKYHSQTPFIPYRLKRKGDQKHTGSVTTME
ncbi:MAG: hypothetical protein V4598_15540 [Bdellovibrionota bacterium]